MEFVAERVDVAVDCAGGAGERRRRGVLVNSIVSINDGREMVLVVVDVITGFFRKDEDGMVNRKGFRSRNIRLCTSTRGEKYEDKPRWRRKSKQAT